jgi:hypothetical protein
MTTIDPARFKTALDPAKVAALVRRFHSGQFDQGDMASLYGMGRTALLIVARGLGRCSHLTKTEILRRIEEARRGVPGGKNPSPGGTHDE